MVLAAINIKNRIDIEKMTEKFGFQAGQAGLAWF